MDDYMPIIGDMQKIVVAKALRDPAFMAQFKDNPRGAVESVFKIKLPAHIQIAFQIAPPNTVQIVFPHVVEAQAGGELSDADLEAVAGGKGDLLDAANPFSPENLAKHSHPYG